MGSNHNLESTVNWPEVDYSSGESLYTGTGEGGMMVYAIFPGYATDPCCLNDVYLDTGEVLVSVEGPMEKLVREHTRAAMDAQMLGGGEEIWKLLTSATVLIGATSSSLYSELRGSYFGVDRIDLTEEGLTLVETLEKLYGETATLVTFLDT